MSVIFWDFDGTIVHSNPLWSNSVYNALKSADINTAVEFSDIRKCMQSGFTWHTPDKDFCKLTGDKWWEFMNTKFYNDYIRLGVKSDIAEKAVKQIRDIIKSKSNYKLYSDAIATLKSVVEKGHKNVILSNNYPDLSDVIKALDLDKYFDKIIVSANIGYDKPRPEIFEYAKNLYPNYNDFIMIGDNPNADIVGGKNANMKTVLVHNEKNNSANYCFNDLKSILDIL